MDLSFSETVSLFEEFKTIFNQPRPPMDKCKHILDKLKLAISKFSFLDPTIAPEQQKNQLLLCREALELATLFSVQDEDIPSFERYIAQVKTFYYDYGSKLPESQRQYMLLGLNLLRLLAKNKLDEFHTELELIPLDFHTNVFVKHSVQLEQWMMEGAYNKVFKAKADVPSQTYVFFMDLLMQTVRNEIADCIDKAYTSLRISELQKILGFHDLTSTKQFIQERNWKITNVNGVEQVTPKEEVHLPPSQQDKSGLPALKLIRQTLSYAKELERIV